MGVDYYTCENCSENFPDCSEYCLFCECGAYFCSEECAKPSNDDNDNVISCVSCRNEVITDYGLVNALLKHFSLTREEAEEIYRKTFPSTFNGEGVDDGKIIPDEFGHCWTLGWEDSDTPHPGFGTMGGHVGQCTNCGMYNYEFSSLRVNEPGKYEGQRCGPKIREC